MRGGWAGLDSDLRGEALALSIKKMTITSSAPQTSFCVIITGCCVFCICGSGVSHEQNEVGLCTLSAAKRRSDVGPSL